MRSKTANQQELPFFRTHVSFEGTHIHPFYHLAIVHSIVRSITTTTAVSVVTSTTAAAPPPSAPLSAVAARRQQLLELANKAPGPVSPEAEEHIEVDNVDIDEEGKASLDSNESGDSDSDDASDQSEGEDSGAKSVAKGAISALPNERRDRR